MAQGGLWVWVCPTDTPGVTPTREKGLGQQGRRWAGGCRPAGTFGGTGPRSDTADPEAPGEGWGDSSPPASHGSSQRGGGGSVQLLHGPQASAALGPPPGTRRMLAGGVLHVPQGPPSHFPVHPQKEGWMPPPPLMGQQERRFPRGTTGASPRPRDTAKTPLPGTLPPRTPPPLPHGRASGWAGPPHPVPPGSTAAQPGPGSPQATGTERGRGGGSRPRSPLGVPRSPVRAETTLPRCAGGAAPPCRPHGGRHSPV